MIRLKPIKVKTDPMNLRKTERAVRAAMDDAKDFALGRFRKTTATWEHAVDFTATATREGYIIGTDDPIYGYVDDGTSPHVIAAKPGKMLAFSVGGRAKTQPGVIGSGAGARGDTRVFAKVVQHPGTAPRGFTEIIGREAEVELSFGINAALAGSVGGD